MSTGGDAMMEEAERQLQKWAPFTSGDDKRDKARSKMLQAATLYKTESNWAGAAKAYERAAEMSRKNKCESDIADDMLNAGLMMQKAGNARAEELLGFCVDVLDRSAKFSQAARVCVQIGDAGGDTADKWYKRGIQYYRNEGQKVTANDIVLKLVERDVEQGNYDSARIQYDKMAREFLDSGITRSNARKYFFLSLLCRVATVSKSNIVEAVEALKEQFVEVEDLDPQFTSLTREHMLISAVIDAMEQESEELYTDAMMDYDSICTLDRVKERLLLRGKQAVRPAQRESSQAQGGLVDDDDCR